jgi:hypothetical protein
MQRRCGPLQRWGRPCRRSIGRRPGVIAGCADVEFGPWPTLTAQGLLIRLAGSWYRSRLRSVHCRVTDPVSFALRAGAQVARFSRLPGFSARSMATQATVERNAWLQAQRRPLEGSGEVLGGLAAAARAALFRASIEAGRPTLPLTMAATFQTLAEQSAQQRGVVEAAAEAYRDFAEDWREPSQQVVDCLDRVVRCLPGYAR